MVAQVEISTFSVPCPSDSPRKYSAWADITQYSLVQAGPFWKLLSRLFLENNVALCCLGNGGTRGREGCRLIRNKHGYVGI